MPWGCLLEGWRGRRARNSHISARGRRGFPARHGHALGFATLEHSVKGGHGGRVAAGPHETRRQEPLGASRDGARRGVGSARAGRGGAILGKGRCRASEVLQAARCPASVAGKVRVTARGRGTVWWGARPRDYKGTA